MNNIGAVTKAVPFLLTDFLFLTSIPGEINALIAKEKSISSLHHKLQFLES
jgi:hypothetical protein